MSRSRFTRDEALRLVQLACLAASTPPADALGAVADGLAAALGAASIAVIVALPGAVQLRYVGGARRRETDALGSRAMALSPERCHGRALRAHGREGPIVAFALPAGEVLVALARPGGAPRFTTRDAALLELAVPIVAAALARGDPGRFDALSPRERQVAEQAARGLGDREIAQALRIGFATVRTHLQRAFAKLGVSSRTELASLMSAALTPGWSRPAARPGGRRPARGR